jgi:Arc/MetJ family transcription regulator
MERGMRTNIEIDDQLLAEAMIAAGEKTKRATVEAALRALLRLRGQKRAGMDMAGLGWEGDLDAMREGRAPD